MYGDDIAVGLLRHLAKLKSDRGNWDSHWTELGRVIWPDADDFNEKRSPGEKRANTVYDSTAVIAAERFASTMEAMLTPRAQTWHRLTSSDKRIADDAGAKEWFEEVSEMLFALRAAPKSGFYSQTNVGYKSLGVFGNACMFIEQHPRKKITYRNVHIGEVYTEVDDAGQVDTVFREYELSAKAAAQKWGAAQLPDKVQASLELNPWQRFTFVHAVVPNIEAYEPQRADYRGMEWLSYHISLEGKQLIGEPGGYREMPYVYSRYTVNPRERYGRSPAMMLLPNIKTLQEMEKTHLRSGQKIADPPLLAADDGVLGSGMYEIKLRPGGVNYGGLNSAGQEMLKPLQTGARLDITYEMMEAKRQTIRDGFLESLFEIFTDHPSMTATEAMIRLQEKGHFVAPFVGRQQSEFLSPLIEREINILDRLGWLPEMPGVLIEAEGEYSITYESPATRMQQAEGLVALQRTFEVIAPLAESDPLVYQRFDSDEVVKYAAEVQGVPDQLLVSDEEMEATREAAAQAQEDAAMAEQGTSAASALKDAASAQQTMSLVPPADVEGNQAALV